MPMRKALFNIWIALMCSTAGAVFSDISVQADGSGCRIDWTLSGFRIDTVRTEGRVYHRISFDGGGYGAEAGSPLIPSTVLSVAIPPSGHADVSVLCGPAETFRNIRTLPRPVFEEVQGIPREVYEEGEAYTRPGYRPTESWSVSDPVQMGPYRIVRITLNPVRYDPVTAEIAAIQSMTVQVRFTVPPPSETVPFRLANRAFYRAAILNYEQAKAWRIRSQVRPVRKRVLQTGPWYRIPVTEEGLYKLTGAFLSDHGIEIGSIDPSTLKIYNNGGRKLPESLSESRPDSLIENPVLVFEGEDGSFGSSDYVLFYGKGVTGWEWDGEEGGFRHYLNPYTEENVYWLTFNDGVPGRRIAYASPVPDRNAQSVSTFREYVFHEQDIVNTETGGRHWVGQSLTADMPSRSYDFTIIDPADDPVDFTFQFYSSMLIWHTFSAYLNDHPVTAVTIKSYRYMNFTGTATSGALEGQNTLTIDYSGSSNLSEAYVDWFEASYLRELRLSGGRLRFTSPAATGAYDFQLSGFDDGTLVLDVTDPAEIRRMRLEPDGEGHRFADAVTDSVPRIYYAADPDGYLSPSTLPQSGKPGLRDPSLAADMILITHSDFRDQAERLAAHRELTDSLSVLVADIQDVYDAYSWGLADPAAIRDFMKTAVETWPVPPSYLLLFGDGDYDYRNLLSSEDKNWIPPYETGGYGDKARATDDWYTYVPDRTAQIEHIMAMAVGRIPVRTAAQAETVVDKIIRYESGSDRGAWRNLVTITSDDEITPDTQTQWTHLDASKDMTENILAPEFNRRPIYITEYPVESTVQGRRTPKGTAALIDQINRGTVFVNYIGHGNEELWADEHIFVRDRDMSRLFNADRHPVFYAATCRFAWFDHTTETSFAEELLVQQGKGGVAVIAATRDCYAEANEVLNARTAEYLMGSGERILRIGDALRLAKTSYRSQYINNEKYHVLGDPSMVLGTPRQSVRITEVHPDTLPALGAVTVRGEVERGGRVHSGFEGHVTLQVFDAEKQAVYKSHTYRLPGNTLFRGDAAVENGRFESTFIVPKDISYGSHTGRISVYVWGEDTDGSGYRDGLSLGGSAAVEDDQGPKIYLSFSGQDPFMSGGMVSGIPELIARIEDDKTGVNLTGDIGHNIVLTLNGEAVDVTEYFNYNEGSYLSGRLTYTLPSLSEQHYRVELKAWDNANNSSTEWMEFEYVSSGRIRIEEVLNYPNPMQGDTHLTFRLNRDAEVEIKVFTVSGRQIRRLSGISAQPGFNMVYWDGRDVAGDALANGIYLYKVTATAWEGTRRIQSSEIGRLMVMR